MKVDARKPRHLRKQNVWYYLPYESEKSVHIYKDLNGRVVEIDINAQKLLRELIAAGVQP